MSAGKGDAPRPVKGEAYRNNYENIFRKNETKHTDTDGTKQGISTGETHKQDSKPDRRSRR